MLYLLENKELKYNARTSWLTSPFELLGSDQFVRASFLKGAFNNGKAKRNSEDS